MAADPAGLELIARGAASAVLLVQAIAMGRGRRTPARLAGALFCLAAAAHVLTQSEAVRAVLGPALAAPWPLSVMGAGLLWAFITELFEDRRRLDWRRFTPALALLAVGSAAAATWPSPISRALWLSHKVIGVSLMAHALVVVIGGWRNDLVEPRRRLRGPILAVAAAYALGVSIVEAAGVLGYQTDALSPVAAGLLLAMSLAGATVFLRADADLFSAPRPPHAGEDETLAPLDRAVLARMRKALDDDEVWRREALTIGELAGMVGAPEHRLRRLINANLGYRNFAAFLNERRIDAAKRALAEPDRASTSISTIAYEVGFASLGPFNRAFKEATGETPTAWRGSAAGRWPISQDPS